MVIIFCTMLGLTLAHWNLVQPDGGFVYNTEPNAMPLGRRNPSTWVDGTNLYIFGGKADTRRLNDLWKYESVSKRWFWQPDTPLEPRSGSCHWFVAGIVWIYGGRNDSSINHGLGDLWSYDLTSRKWNRHDHPSNPGIRYGSYSWTDNAHLYLFGGKSNSNTILGDAWRFDTKSFQWQLVNFTRAILPPRDDGVATKIGNILYFFDGNKFSTLDVQTINVTEITSQGGSPIKREDYVMWSNGSIIYLFGGRATGEIYNDFWSFDIRTNTWISITNNKPSGRWGSGFGTSQNGDLYLFGGSLSGSTSLANDVWTFGSSKSVSVTPPFTSEPLYPAIIAILILTIFMVVMIPISYYFLWRKLSSTSASVSPKASGTSNDFATV